MMRKETDSVDAINPKHSWKQQKPMEKWFVDTLSVGVEIIFRKTTFMGK